MKKLKIYLDTSVISYLYAPDTPEEMDDTLKLWKEMESGKYDVYISDVVLDEVIKCYEPKQTLLKTYLGDIKYNLLLADDEVIKIANLFIELGVLTRKRFDDCRHIALAIKSDCDIIISWNFKHIVNYKMINGVKIIAPLTGYREVGICSPTMLIEGVDEI